MGRDNLQNVRLFRRLFIWFGGLSMKKKVIKVLEKVENVIYADNWQYVAIYAAVFYLIAVILI